MTRTAGLALEEKPVRNLTQFYCKSEVLRLGGLGPCQGSRSKWLTKRKRAANSILENSGKFRKIPGKRPGKSRRRRLGSFGYTAARPTPDFRVNPKFPSQSEVPTIRLSRWARGACHRGTPARPACQTSGRRPGRARAGQSLNPTAEISVRDVNAPCCSFSRRSRAMTASASHARLTRSESAGRLG